MSIPICKKLLYWENNNSVNTIYANYVQHHGKLMIQTILQQAHGNHHIATINIC